MSQWSEHNASYSTLFYHVCRHPELVVIKDRDVMAFVPDVALLDATSGMTIWRDQAKSFLQWETADPENVIRSERILVWARTCGTEIVSGFRWVPYITSRDVDAYNIKPLREVFDPRVAYDRSSNMLHIWFWTNVKWGYTGTDYDESQLYVIGMEGYQSEMGFPGAPAQKLKRVLCYATGMLGHWYIEGGFIAGFQGLQGVQGPQGPKGFQSNIYDLVPVFTLPRIITNFAPGIGPGMITDGWYENSGFGGPQGPIGWQGDRGPQGGYGPDGFKGYRGYRGYQGYQGYWGYQGCPACAHGTSTGSSVIVYLSTDDNPHCWQLNEDVCIAASDGTNISYSEGLVSFVGATYITVWNFDSLPSGGAVVCHSKCIRGPQGFQGPQGWWGLQGPQGLQGLQGAEVKGFIGPDGFAGTSSMGNQGPQGEQGNQGFMGLMGPRGLQGPQGPQGFQGHQGYQGDQGTPGLQGYQGYQGVAGDTTYTLSTMGLQGNQGWGGPQGIQGWGPDGYDGDKHAILKTSQGYRELTCIEAPEVLFFDILSLRCWDKEDVFAVGKTFVEICEPDSIRIVSVVSSKLVPVGGKMVTGHSFAICRQDAQEDTVTVVLVGTRKGFGNRRFVRKTQHEYEENWNFWKKPWED